ncbi:MAG TPA: type II secretion system protein E [Clostridiales bacterium]|nr:type II secretion system protein E [Clostridiales bacterium]
MSGRLDRRRLLGGAFGEANPTTTAPPAGSSVRDDLPEDLMQRIRSIVLDHHGGLLEAARSERQRRGQLRTLITQVLVAEGYGGRQSSDALADRMVDHLVGYGPVEPLLADPEVTEIMVNGPHRVYVERGGRIELTPCRFRDEDHLEDVIARIVAPLGRRIDYSLPFVDARLSDGSRVHAMVRPLTVRGPALTIRKFCRQHLTVQDLVQNGTLTEEMADFLAVAVRGRLNLLISGGAGSGKTTTLNALSAFIPDGAERIVTIEDAAELRLQQDHVVALEARPPNLEGRGEVTVRMLLRNALRMRPDRIVIGECRGGEAFDLLQAMNTGHDGCMSTIHANSCADALTRLENMVLLADANLPHRAIQKQVRAGVEVLVHQARFADGRRRICEIAVVQPGRGDGLSRIFDWDAGRGQSWRLPCAIPPRMADKLALSGQSFPELP